VCPINFSQSHYHFTSHYHYSLFTIMSNKLSISIPTHGVPLPSQMPHSKRCVSTNGNNPPFHSKPLYRFPPSPSLPTFFLHLTSTNTLLHKAYSKMDLSHQRGEFHLWRRWCIFPISKHYYIIAPLPSCQNILQVELLGLHHATSFLMASQHHLHFYSFPLQECVFITSPPLKHTMGICALVISLGQK
jgi:hypothetical protein